MTNHIDVARPPFQSNKPENRNRPLLQVCFEFCFLLWFAVSVSAQTSSVPVANSAPSNPPTQDYLVYVVCESADKVVLIRFGPGGARIESQAHIGLMPTDINGPHGIVVSPDKKYFYVAQGHGRPDGSAWKFNAGSNTVIKYTSLGLFPATTDISRDGNFIYVANANFHGEMNPSSISVVATDQMIEVKRIPTCTMPHGSRLNPAGTKHYSVCMMDDMLVEIDTSKFAVDRYFTLAPGKEMGMTGAPYPNAGIDPNAGAMGDHKMMDHKPVCTPTWAQPSNDGSIIYVACNQSNDIVAVKTDTWTMAPPLSRRNRCLQSRDDQRWTSHRHQQARTIRFHLRSGERKGTSENPDAKKDCPRRSRYARRSLRLHFRGRRGLRTGHSRSDRPRLL